MSATPGILARGPWAPEQVRVTWLDDAYEPPSAVDRLADVAVDALREDGTLAALEDEYLAGAGAPVLQ